MRALQQCVPQSALPGPCVHARPVSCKAQPLTGFVLVFPRGNAPTTLWFSLPPAFCVRGLGLMSMSEAVVNSSPLLFRCVFVGDSSIFVTNIFSLILGIFVAVLARPDGENLLYGR